MAENYEQKMEATERERERMVRKLRRKELKNEEICFSFFARILKQKFYHAKLNKQKQKTHAKKETCLPVGCPKMIALKIPEFGDNLRT